MKKSETSEYRTVTERPIYLALAERQRAAEAARQAEIENPSIRKLLPELQSSAEESVDNLVKAFSKLAKRHEDIIQLEAALNLANDEIILLNDDRPCQPYNWATTNIKARNVVRAKADQLQIARDLEV